MNFYFKDKGKDEYARVFLNKIWKCYEDIFLDSNINPEKPDVPLNKNDAFQKVQKRRVQEKR